jgi:hypothetical protein
LIAGNTLAVVPHFDVKSLGSIHLRPGFAEDRSGPGILRIRIEVAAEQQHQFQIEPDGPAIREAMFTRARDSEADREPHLFLFDSSEQWWRKRSQMCQHFVLEGTEHLVSEPLKLVLTDNHGFWSVLS